MMMNWFKYHNKTPLEFFASAGIYFPVAFLFETFGEHKWGFDINLVPTWLFFSVVISLIFLVYIIVHLLPPKVVIIAGFLGWLAIPIALLIKVISE
jgi:hypothetical protein